MKLLYIHGYNGDPYGNSYNNLKNVCGDKYELHSIDYNPAQPKEAISLIHEYVNEHRIDGTHRISAEMAERIINDIFPHHEEEATDFCSKLKEIDNAPWFEE